VEIVGSNRVCKGNNGRVTSIRFEFKCWAAESPPTPSNDDHLQRSLTAFLPGGESSLRDVPMSRVFCAEEAEFQSSLTQAGTLEICSQ